MSVSSTADSFMCNRNDQNEKVNLSVEADNTSRSDSTTHSEGHIDLSAGISLLTHKSTKKGGQVAPWVPLSAVK